MGKSKVKEQAGRRTTIYRMIGVADLREAVRSKYFEADGFTTQDVKVGDRDALLITGAMVTDRAKWCAAVAEVTGHSVQVSGSTPAGVLVLRPSREVVEDVNVAYCLTYGMGFQLLEPTKVDTLFGQRVAIRTARVDKLRSITTTTLDDRSRTSRSSIPQGDGPIGFGLGDVGEAVSRVVAAADLTGLSWSTDTLIQVRGADALNAPIGRSAHEVIKDLDVLEKTLLLKPPEELKLLEQLTIVKNPALREVLDGSLSNSLDDDGGEIRVGLSWPHERIDDNGTPDAWRPFRLFPRGEGEVRPGQPTWDDIAEALRAQPVGTRLNRVANAKIQLYRDEAGEDPISQAIPLRRWIAFQTELNGHTYALYDGNWYQIHHDYTENINRRTHEIFSRKADGIHPPPWDANYDEAAYNKVLAEELGGICLDRRLIRTQLHPRGIEACDIYLHDGTLIHVKKTEDSGTASHLLAQALVSADALCNDEEAREKLRNLISDAGGDPKSLDMKPSRVILAMHRRNRPPMTAKNLFTFTRVNLVRQVTNLESRGVPVRIVPILSSEKV